MSPAKILIVDDDPEIRALLSRYLAKEGYETQESDNGREGLVMAKSGQFDLIILDKILPEIDGFKISRLLKSDKKLSKTPVMILTALTDAKNKMAGYESDADEYETKPVEKDNFLKKVKNLIVKREEIK